MKVNTAALATTPERKLSHFQTIYLNTAVNILAIDTLKRLYDFPYGRMSMMGYVHKDARMGLLTGVCVSTYGLTYGRNFLMPRTVSAQTQRRSSTVD